MELTQLQEDEALVDSYKRHGSQEAFNLLLRKFSSQIDYLCRSLYAPGLGFGDLFQEGSVGLFEAVNRFDPNRGVRFYSYAKLHIKGHIINAVKTALRKKQSFLNYSSSIDEDIPSHKGKSNKRVEIIDSCEPSPEDIYIALIDQKERELRYIQIMRSFSPFEQQVLRHLMSGLTYKDTAEKMGVSFKSVDNAMSRVKRKLFKIRNDLDQIYAI